MANVMELLRKIKTAIYGRDVRQSIYDAILQCYQDATGNPESIAAHTGDTNNPHNVTAEQVGLANAAEDISQAKKDISGLKNPEFEDFTAEGSTPPDARTAIAAITSKMSFFTYLSKVKAALMGLVTLGEMRSLLINNGLTTEAGKYFLDAAYGKTLSDLVASNASAIIQLNSDFTAFSRLQDSNTFIKAINMGDKSKATITPTRINMSIDFIIVKSAGNSINLSAIHSYSNTQFANEVVIGSDLKPTKDNSTGSITFTLGQWSVAFVIGYGDCSISYS